MAKRVAAAGPVEGPWALPDEWRWERLGEMAGRIAEKHKPDPASVLPFVGMDAIAPRSMVVSATQPFGQLRSAASAFQKGDVLYGRLRPYLNKVWYADYAGACSGELIVIRPSDDLDAQYLAYLLHSDAFVEFASHAVAGDRPRIDFGTMAAFPVPVPPIDVQGGIVARIGELFAEIDDGEAALARARDNLATWRKALLKAAVTGELTADWRAANPSTETGAALLARILADRRARWEAGARNKGKRYKEPLAPNMDALPPIPEGWTWASFDQLVDQLSNGISAKPAHSPPGIPILRISSVRPMLVRDDQRRWLPQDFPVGGAMVKQGDLLFTRYNGNPELVGVCGRYRGETPVAYPDKVMCAPLSSANNAIGDFLELAMNAGASRNHIAAYTKTSAGQHGVAGSSVKVAPVPIPPQAELEHIVQVYRDASTQAEDGWSNAVELNAISATLRQSILAAAFRGELA